MNPLDRNLVIVHGGVAGSDKEEKASLGPAVTPALSAESALDAVEAAVAALEEDPLLNAGYGSVLDREGRLEMDAGIADGSTGRAAGVANVTVRHPISLARRVLEETPHVFLAGQGAMLLAEDMELLEDSTSAQRARWEKARAEECSRHITLEIPNTSIPSERLASTSSDISQRHLRREASLGR